MYLGERTSGQKISRWIGFCHPIRNPQEARGMPQFNGLKIISKGKGTKGQKIFSFAMLAQVLSIQSEILPE